MFEHALHVHDCEGCTHLGRYGETDLYICRTDGKPLHLDSEATMIQRFSSDPPDYRSMPVAIYRGVMREWTRDGLVKLTWRAKRRPVWDEILRRFGETPEIGFIEQPTVFMYGEE